MSIYEKSTKELLKDFAANLKPGQVFTRSSVVNWFKQHYPKINPATVGMHLEVMSTNSESRQHWPHVKPTSGHDVFYKVGRGQFRLWERDRDPTPNHPNVPSPLGGASSTDTSALNEGHEDIEATADGSAGEFAYEEQLKTNLAGNLHQIEAGLRLYEDDDGEFNGLEFLAGGRRIDILAVDRNGDFVVLELKVSVGHERTIGQLARYMAWAKQNLAGPKKVRGMIVAARISDDLRLAASILPDVVLVEYQMSLSFKTLLPL